MTDRVECVVIGAGVVGLAVARSLAQSGRETVVLEAANAIGTVTSSRNSGVVHAGIYYPRGSLKARLCVQGRRLLYDFCETHGVDVRVCGKIIVATIESQLGALSAIAAAGRLNGVDDLRFLERSEVRRLEPELHCVAALHSPSTGIVDSHALMLALHADLEKSGGSVVLGTHVREADSRGSTLHLITDGTSASELEAVTVVNCAGLGASTLAQRFPGIDEGVIPKIHLAKGNYFKVDGRVPFRHLIYPMPTDGGLGVHLTLDLAGHARFGPDVEWVEEIDYRVDPERVRDFYLAIRSYWPGLQEGSLRPDYAGTRPKLSGPGEGARDFQIQGPEVHGIPGLIQLFGIDSPGLTAALALGEHVRQMLAN